MTVDRTTSPDAPTAADGPENTPAPEAGEQTGPLVALEIGGGWVLGREGEAPEEGRKMASFEDGSIRTYRNRPGTVRSVTPGSLLHRLVQAPEVMKQRMKEAPADVVVEILEEQRGGLNKREIEAKLDDLRLLPEGEWWASASKQLKAHPRVQVTGARYGLKRQD